VEEILGLMELKLGCPRPLLDSASTSVFCKWVKCAFIRREGLLMELFFLAAAKSHEAGTQ
jgi:hypothetical protein